MKNNEGLWSWLQKLKICSSKGKSQLQTIQIFLASLMQVLCSCNFRVFFELLILVYLLCAVFRKLIFFHVLKMNIREKNRV